jgi:hypothetical protein
MKTSMAILVCSLIGITPALVLGTTIAQWNFDASPQTAASFDPNAPATSFTLSSGGTINFYQGNPSTGKAISGTGWNAASPTASGAQWWEFTVTANAGYVLDLTSLTFDDQKSSTGPANWSVTINGVDATPPGPPSTHSTFSTTPMDTVSLTAFQNLPSADVKIIGYGATSSLGTWRLDNVTLNGLVSPVPDSISCLAVLAWALGLLAALGRLTRVNGPWPQGNA